MKVVKLLGPALTIVAILELAPSLGPKPAYGSRSHEPKMLAQLPTIHKIEGSQAGIEIMLNGKSAILSVDTGSGYHYLIPKFAEAIKVRPEGKPIKGVNAWGGATVDFPLPRLAVVMGQWKSQQGGFLVEDMPPFNVREPGILSPQRLAGVGFFVFDFPGRQMLLFDQIPENWMAWTGRRYSSYAFERLSTFNSLGPNDLEGGVTYVNATINSLRAGKMLLDTGGRLSSFSDKYITDKPVRFVDSGVDASGKSIQLGVVKGQTLHLGAHQIPMAETQISPESFMKGLDGVIGMDILKNFVVVVDYKGGQILIGFPK